LPSRPPSRDARCEMALALVRSLNPRPPLASAPPVQSGHTSAPSALPPHPLLPVLLLLLPRPLSLALSPAAPLCSSRADRDCTHRSLRALSLSPRLLPVRGTGARRRRAASDARSSPFCVEELGRTCQSSFPARGGAATGEAAGVRLALRSPLSPFLCSRSPLSHSSPQPIISNVECESLHRCSREADRRAVCVSIPPSLRAESSTYSFPCSRRREGCVLPRPSSRQLQTGSYTAHIDQPATEYDERTQQPVVSDEYKRLSNKLSKVVRARSWTFSLRTDAHSRIELAGYSV